MMAARARDDDAIAADRASMTTVEGGLMKKLITVAILVLAALTASESVSGGP
jgi:hypothetical protein